MFCAASTDVIDDDEISAISTMTVRIIDGNLEKNMVEILRIIGKVLEIKEWNKFFTFQVTFCTRDLVGK